MTAPDPRPVWLLDVDGVLNATRPGWGGPPLRRHVADAGGTTWPIRWAPPLLRRIRQLIDAGTVEVIWSTTWCGQTAGLEQAFGLPALPCAFAVPGGRYVGDVKLAAARKVVADRRPLIWTDDMETPEVGPLYDELTTHGTALLIRPDPRRGLQPEHMDLIESFIAEHTAAAAA